jgi:hypothetical protein
MGTNSISTLLTHAENQIAESAAMEYVLRALIVTHPDRKGLRLAIELLSKTSADDMRDYGFESSKTPDAVHAVTSLIEKYVNRWLELIDRIDGPKADAQP